MKRLILNLSTFLTLLLLTAPSFASASSSYFWQSQISSLPQYTTTHEFNVQYTVLSSEPNKNFKVQLYQSSDHGNTYTTCGTQIDTSTDPNPNATYGNSGYVPACVSADGTYTFKFAVSPDTAGGTDVSSSNQTASTTVDTTPPPAPSYAGKTQSGNTYNLSFSEPSGDATIIKIYASTSKIYTADSSTQVSPALAASATSFSYTAPDNLTRYFSLQAFDAAGNGSSLVGDPGIIVHPTVFTNLNGNGVPSVAAAQAAAATPATGTGQVQGATTNTPNGGTGGGQVNAPGSSTSNKSQNKGKVLGASVTVPNSSKGWYIGGGIMLVVLLLTYWFVLRGRLFKRGGSPSA